MFREGFTGVPCYYGTIDADDVRDKLRTLGRGDYAGVIRLFGTLSACDVGRRVYRNSAGEFYLRPLDKPGAKRSTA